MAAQSENKATRPNIIWIISDDTKHAELGYAGGNVLSPHIDSIAANGIAFTHFHCVSPACTPSRYNYLTGHYGGRCPADSFRARIPAGEAYSVEFNTNLDPEKETCLPQVLQDAGYFTGFTGKWHVGAGKEDISWTKEIDKSAHPYDPATSAMMKAQQGRLCEIVGRSGFEVVRHVIWGNHDALVSAAHHHNIEYIAKGALDFLDEAAVGDRPFFLNVATTTMHAPDHASSLMKDPRITAEGIMDDHIGCMPERATIYERITNAGLEFNHVTAGVLWMDDCVGAILDRVRQLGIEEETIVIFSTDHGPVGGKFTLYEPGVRLPFVLQWKGRIAAGMESDAMAQSIDLAPTLFELAGVAPPEGMVLDGRSLVSAMNAVQGSGSAQLRPPSVAIRPSSFRTGGRGCAEPQAAERSDVGPVDPFASRDLYFEYGYQRALRSGRWKYMAWRLPQRLLEQMKESGEDVFFDFLGKPIDPDNIRPTVIVPLVPRIPYFFDPDQLYDLANDPGETVNLAASSEHADVLREMKQRLQERLDTFADPFNVTADPDPFYFSDRFTAMVARVRRTYDRLHEDWRRGKGRISGFARLVPPGNKSGR